MKFFKNLSFVCAAGCVGGLAKALAAAAFSQTGINAALGSNLAQVLSPQLIYDHVVWGGIWGLLFLIPLRQLSHVWRGVLFSLGQTALQLFFDFPRMGQDLLGLKLGLATPFLVLFFGILWGVAAGLWLQLMQKD